MMGYDGYGWSMMGFGGIWMILLWLAFIWFIFWLVSQIKQPEKELGNTPLEMLKYRYAKGEITKKEYEATKRDILQ